MATYFHGDQIAPSVSAGTALQAKPECALTSCEKIGENRVSVLIRNRIGPYNPKRQRGDAIAAETVPSLTLRAIRRR